MIIESLFRIFLNDSLGYALVLRYFEPLTNPSVDMAIKNERILNEKPL